MTIPAILMIVFVICCLIWAGTYILQALLVLLAIAWSVLCAVVPPLVGLIVFVFWFPFQPKRALAALKGQAPAWETARSAPYVREHTDLGLKPFRRRSKSHD